MRVLVVAILLSCCLIGDGRADGLPPSPPTPDTTRVDTAASTDWLVLPFASYAPDTKIAVGLLGGYYRTGGVGRATADGQVSITVTQRRQVILQLTSELYSPRGAWRGLADVEASRYPNSFYGIGDNTPAEREETYTSRYLKADVSAQRRVQPHLRVGPRVFVWAETDPTVEGACVSGRRTPLACDAVPGSAGGRAVGVGGQVTWDTRDSRYYPRRGTFADVSALGHAPAWGSEETFARLVADLRGYHAVGPGVAAAQFYTEAVAGTAPFQLLPLLGGDERLRGYREGRYRDDVYWTAQAEYRMPLFWRFKATVFGAVGDVGGAVDGALVRTLEGAVGVGGRLRLTDDGVHGRLDVAYSPTGVEIYVSLGEAF